MAARSENRDSSSRPIDAPSVVDGALSDGGPAGERPEWPTDASSDALVGSWRIWQRRRGHRTSTDDLLTAWLAVATAGRPVARYADIGCGIGSVLLMTAHALRPAVCVGVEAQPQSVAMARRSVAELPDAPPITIVESDLRDVGPEQLGGSFDLVTGSPPYLPVSTGIVSPDPQRAACRFELRGGVEGYCEAAARLLTPNGGFCLVFQTTWDARVLAAGRAAGLHLTHRADVRTRAAQTAPFLSVYRFGREPCGLEARELAVRGDDGEITPEYAAARALLGLGV
ncbi:MAG: methyltransferase domain-containing protein [Myxococcales bacterium]|nr:methyltransferase domain-containing protein [Myxococcales bacterium]MCB9520134.1 methyltransferase domain-containing protein [Myxococcales bacterium]MCB9531245.1 methyltransferase domain-containing protein [Myxococcales bacterium]